MSQRESTLLWLRDILEHLTANQQRLEWTTDREAAAAGSAWYRSPLHSASAVARGEVDQSRRERADSTGGT